MMVSFSKQVLVLLLGCWLLPLAFSAPVQDQERLSQEAEEAYRRGEYEQATTLWQDALALSNAEAGTSALRGHLLYNLGNAAERAGEPLRALAWYQAALRHLPRDGHIRHNRDFVRGAQGLPPADGDGLGATLRAGLRAFTPAESACWPTAGFALLALALGYEALRGGRTARQLAWPRRWLAVLLALAPRAMDARAAWSRCDGNGGTRLQLSLYSEPRGDAQSLIKLEATELVEPRTTGMTWTRVRTRSGQEGWVSSVRLQDIWY
ncbi:MAG: SH3 domain-containing protein [Planctomycetota bacterium]